MQSWKKNPGRENLGPTASLSDDELLTGIIEAWPGVPDRERLRLYFFVYRHLVRSKRDQVEAAIPPAAPKHGGRGRPRRLRTV